MKNSNTQSLTMEPVAVSDESAPPSSCAAESVDLNVGGQAVIEGVMMRSANAIATAVRLPDGSIELKHRPYTSLVKRFKFLNIPVLRGALSFFEMLLIGLDTLNWSADQQLKFEDREQGANSDSSWNRMKNGLVLGATMLFAFAMAMGIFFALPIWIATLLGLARGAFTFNLVAGAIRLSLFVLYIAAISRMPDIRRVFRYHGAEHMSIFALESACDLNIKSARTQSRFHPRCGTSFILIVALFSVFMFGIADSIFVLVTGHVQSLAERLATHISLLPLVGGISFELLKLSGKLRSRRVVQILMTPGLWLQRFTTAEPDDDMIEVALHALKAALGREESAT